MNLVETFSAMALVIVLIRCVNVVDEEIITEIFGQFLIFIISKCVSVIFHIYVYVPYGGGGGGG